MNYDYDVAAMRKTLAQIIADNVPSEEMNVLQQRAARFELEKKTGFFNLTFTAIPRFIKKKNIITDLQTDQALQNIREGFSVGGWTSDRLARNWWLLQFPTDDKMRYVQQIENLFKAAEMNEQVALYGSLPLLAYPDAFAKRASEGLRTNIRQVFEAIALDNPYPADYLEEAAWNQMVLKGFFMGIAVNRIVGLDKRANEALANILCDYAHERQAAGRPVNPLLWRPVGKFIDEKIFPDIQKLFQSGDQTERKAAALACAQSDFEQARILLQEHHELESQIKYGALVWKMLERD